MKKIILLLSFIVSFIFSFAQPKVQRSTGSNTVVDQRVAAGLNLYIPVYQDTVAANLSSPNNIGLDSCGAIIYTRNPQAKWTRYCSPKRWVMDVSISNITINNIFNNSITNTTIINQTDSSVNISICNGQNVCDTLTLVTNVTNVTYSSSNFIDNTHIQFCGLDTITQIITCDTVTIPTQILYTFQRGLNEPAAGVVNFGSDTAKQITLLTNDAALIGTTGDSIINFHPNGLIDLPTYDSSHNDGLISKFLGVDQYGHVLAGSLPTQDSCGRFSGLFVTWDSLLVFDISPGTWASCCDLISRQLLVTDTVHLDTTATNPRFDAIVAGVNGIEVVKGIASANPAFPTVDECQIILAYVLINAGDDVPADVCQNLIYDEADTLTEYRITHTMAIDSISTTNPAHLLRAINTTSGFTNGQHLDFTWSSPIQVSNYTALKFYLKKKATFSSNVQIRITWYNGGVPVSVARNIATAAYGYSRTNTNYQIFTIPMPDFGFTGTSATTIRFTLTNSNSQGFYIDWIQLQGCLVQPPPTNNGIQQWTGTGNTLFNIVTANPNGANTSITTPINNAAAYTVWGNSTNVSAQPSYTQVNLSTAMVTGLLPVTNLSIGNAGDILTMVGDLPTWASASTGYDTTLVELPLRAKNGTVRDTLTLPISVGSNGDSAVFLNRGTGLLQMRKISAGISGITADNGLTASTSTNVQLGSATPGSAIFLSDRFVNTDIHGLILYGSSAPVLQVSNTGGVGILASADNSVAVSASTVNSHAIFGRVTPSSTNSVVPILKLARSSSGTAAIGLGGSIDLILEADDGIDYVSNQLIHKWTNADGPSNITSQFIITGTTAASTQDWLTLGQSGYMKLRGMNVTEAGAITAADGMILYVTNTDGTFTSVGFWGRENGAWVKL